MTQSRKRKTTIFKQLLLSVLLPVVVLIAALSVYNFLTQKEQVHEIRQQNIQNVTEDISGFLAFFDKAILEIEKDLSDEARRISYFLTDSVFQSTANILTTDLDSLRQTLGVGDFDIYIIDTTGTIVNTTFEKDLGLQFFTRGDYYRKHFGRIWAEKKYVEDRISVEVITNRPKKYTYQSTHDQLYIVELGIYSDHAASLIEHFVQQLNDLPDTYEGIDSVSVFFGTDEFSTYYQGHSLKDYEKSSAMNTLKSEQNTSVSREEDDVVYTSEFRYLEMEGAHLHPGYILRVVHNDQEEQKVARAALLSFGKNVLIFVLPIFLLILWRARVLVRPIVQLVDKTDEIRGGKLDERVPIYTRNEIGDLSEHFNSMVDQLQESYRNLEHKVDERTLELRQQKEIVEHKNQEILDSINYAKRIQAAILPSDNLIKKYLPESFVMYRPKDIVAGDFYWMETNPDGDDWLIFAAADCTGHGVPGAMVSVVCHNALNRSVREYNLSDPGKILDKTADLVIEQFEKSKDDVKDGMDISLCAYNRKKSQLLWSGAHNPLLIIRAENPEEIIEIKGDKQPVGKYLARKPFTTHKVDVQSGDMVYMTTDGFIDQFGGPRGKKYKSVNFKKLLVSIGSLEPDAQKSELRKVFTEWQGDLEQLDDVCVFGFRVR